MLTCKQVSHALSKEDYAKLPPFKRFCLKLHVRLCIICGRFNRQVMESQDMCRCYKEREDEIAIPRQSGLDPAQKQQMKAMLAEQSQHGAE